MSAARIAEILAWLASDAVLTDFDATNGGDSH